MPTRRTFTLAAIGTVFAAASSVGGAALAFVLGPLRRRAPLESSSLDLGPASAFEALRAGTSGPEEVVVERTVEDGYMTRRVKERFAVVPDAKAASGLAALSTTCTHLGCGVSWNGARKAFLCPCHGGVYGPDGEVLSGPPPKPLTRMPLVVSGGRLRLDVTALDA
jgi:menaquinol-cytochrome c reductase iron-sulfur subunit